MPPRKTTLAHAALQSHRAPLDMRQRRALILSDGHRSVAELTAMLGPDAPALLARLCEMGYLARGGESATVAPAVAVAPPQRRRSLAATRIYLMDILELQRDPRARPLRDALRAAHDDTAMLQAMLAALAQLPAMTSASYAGQVRQRVAEVLPETHLAMLGPMPEAAG